jgi:hypothetical protein
MKPLDLLNALAKPLDGQYVELVKRLVDRLERLSADSTYAHKASGLRGSLMRYMERIEAGEGVNRDELDQGVEFGFKILQEAAKEIGASK